MTDFTLGRKTFKVGDIFTDTELNKAQRIYRQSLKADASAISLIDRLHDEIVAPVMSRINKATGQENDSRYMAYMLQWVITQAGR
jgi:hypothetical protein